MIEARPVSELQSSIIRNTSTSSPPRGTSSRAISKPAQRMCNPPALYPLELSRRGANRSSMNRYYQRKPDATVHFPAVASLNDSIFSRSNFTGNSWTNATDPNLALGWGLRVLNSQGVLVYGAGLTFFFNKYNTSKSRSCRPHSFKVTANP